MRAILTLLLLAFATAALSSGAPQPPAPSAQSSDFRQRFEQAMKINSVDEMGRLIRQHDEEAIRWIIETVEAIAVMSSDELEDRISALRRGWERSMGTDFVDKMHTYLSLLSPQLKRERDAARPRYDKAVQRYADNAAKKDRPTYGLLATEFKGLAGIYEQLGDHYYASQSWLLYGLCVDSEQMGDAADLYEAAAAYKASIRAREAISLKDRFYAQAQQRYAHLAAQGYAEKPGDKSGPGAPAGAGAKQPSGPTATAAMEFQLVTRLDNPERPSYYADDFYQVWEGLSLQARGSTATFNKLEQLSPTAVRRGDSQVVLQVEGSEGKREIEVPMTGRLEPVRFEIGSGAERRPWAVLTTLGVPDDRYQGLQINLGPSGEYLTIYAFNAGSMVGQVAGTRVQVLDDNMDGIYGSPPRAWQNLGMSEGHDQPELDSIVVGSESRARPWSELQKIGGVWYRLEAQQGGTELAYTPVEVQTGFLSLDFGGSQKPSWVVVRGTGPLENSYFDLVGARGRGAEVPVGTYSLFYGEVRKGRRQQMAKALMVPGRATPRWQVREGEVTQVPLGAPFSYDFTFQVKDGELVVPGRSVVVVGSAGERYERPWNCVPTPDVIWREKGSRRASRAEGMDAILDTDPIYSEGYKVAWSPRDLRLPLPQVRTSIEVQLVDRRHKLFGRIESDWKE